jgi:hypothetical protein
MRTLGARVCWHLLLRENNYPCGKKEVGSPSSWLKLLSRKSLYCDPLARSARCCNNKSGGYSIRCWGRESLRNKAADGRPIERGNGSSAAEVATFGPVVLDAQGRWRVPRHPRRHGNQKLARYLFLRSPGPVGSLEIRTAGALTWQGTSRTGLSQGGKATFILHPSSFVLPPLTPESRFPTPAPPLPKKNLQLLVAVCTILHQRTNTPCGRCET